eukprot:3692260-Prymnesium_polylepis.1
MEWSCHPGQYMPLVAMVESGDFHGCASSCAPGTVWLSPEHRTATCGGLCTKGFFCEAGQPPEPCPRGKQMPSEGASSSEACLPCTLGYYGPNEGAERCVPCGSGTFTVD